MYALIATVALLIAPPLQAIGLAPTRFDLDLSEPRTVSVELRVEGRADSETLIDFTIVPRDSAIPADAGALDIAVQPPQLVLPAGGSARVRIVARSDRPLGASRSFYLVAEHVAVQPADADGIQRVVDLVTRVHLPLHVAAGGTPAVEARVVNDGEQRLLRIDNHGRRYQRLSVLMLRDAASGLDGAALARRAATDAVLPGQTLFIPLDDGELADGQAAVLTVEIAP